MDANTPGIKVGDLIALIAGPGEDWKEVAASAPKVTPAAESPKEEKPTAVPTPQPAESSTVAAQKVETTGPRSSAMGPAVRALLHKHNLDASQVPATGPHGQLLKGLVWFVKSYLLIPINSYDCNLILLILLYCQLVTHLKIFEFSIS